MTSLLIDTSVLIDFLRRQDKVQTLFAVLVQEMTYQFSVSILTHTELYSGKSVWGSSKRKQELEDLLAGLSLLPLSSEVSLVAGKLVAEHNLDLVDAVIAGTALEHSLPIVTLNVRDFKKVKGLKLFSL